MKQITFALVIVIIAATSAHAQDRSVTTNENYSYAYRNRSAENLGFAQFGLTAFLALLDSSTGVRQNGVPAPGYPQGQIYPYGSVVVAPPVVYGAVVCSDPSWCTFPSPLGPGPGADGFAVGFDAGRRWARERRIAEAVRYHQAYAVGMDAGAATYGW